MIKKKSAQPPMSLPPFSQRQDFLGGYLESYTKGFLFDELSEAYLKREGLLDILKGVPIPLRAEDLAAFKEGGLSILCLAENMAVVLGVNPSFPHGAAYMAYMRKYFNEKIADALVKKGRDLAEENRVEEGVVRFRAALCLNPENLHAMYSYARGCRELYLKGEELSEEDYDPDYVARFKAESTEYFELTTLVHPEFAQSYYFLGYAYLNLGLCRKASITFEQFLERSRNGKDRKEIKERLVQLEQPVRIEDGVNQVLAGRWHEGIQALAPFLETPFEDWWPLHYYLGTAYVRTDQEDQALKAFHRVLELFPSHVETMKELSDIYEQQGQPTLAEKYQKKAKLVESQMGEE